jgi:hypothetical protein
LWLANFLCRFATVPINPRTSNIEHRTSEDSSPGPGRHLSMNRSVDLQSAYHSKTEISLTTQSRLQIGAPVQGSIRKFSGNSLLVGRGGRAGIARRVI